MITFYLVRHADKDGPPGLLSGREPGVGLTAAGRARAERIAGALAAEPIRRVLSSPLERARQTASPTARRFGVEIERSDAIRDIDYGAWTDRTAEELEGNEEWRRYHRGHSTHRIPGGELLLEVQSRFVSEVLRMRSEVHEGGVAFFSHGDPIKLALAWFAGAPLDLFDRFAVASGSISVVTLTDGGPLIEEVNRRVDPLQAIGCSPASCS